MMLRRLAFPVVLLVGLAVPLASCGGGDSAGTDESYVRELCVATASFKTDVDKAVKDASAASNSSAAMERIADPIDAFAKAFAKANPPEDLKSWHSDAAKSLQAMADKFRKEKTFSALSGMSDTPVPDPPAAAKKRLTDVSKNVKECQGVVLFRPS